MPVFFQFLHCIASFTEIYSVYVNSLLLASSCPAHKYPGTRVFDLPTPTIQKQTPPKKLKKVKKIKKRKKGLGNIVLSESAHVLVNRLLLAFPICSCFFHRFKVPKTDYGQNSKVAFYTVLVVQTLAHVCSETSLFVWCFYPSIFFHSEHSAKSETGRGQDVQEQEKEAEKEKEEAAGTHRQADETTGGA